MKIIDGFISDIDKGYRYITNGWESEGVIWVLVVVIVVLGLVLDPIYLQF